MSGKNLLVLAFTLLQLGLWTNVWAYDWSNDYGIDLNAGQDENFRLAETNEIDTTSTSIGVFANLQGRTEVSSIDLTLGANSTRYSESEIDDSDGYNLSLDTSRRGERLSGSLAVSAASQSTTQTELLDSGNVVDGERETTSIAPGLSYQLDERNSVFANPNVRDVTYDTVSLVEYTDTKTSVGWGYEFDEASDLSITLRTSEYDPEDDEPTDRNSLSLGYKI